MGCGYGAKIVRSLRQDYPFISGGVAHHVIELIYASGVLPAVAEEKATAGVLWTDRPVAGKEGQRRVRKWQLFSRRDANEIGSCCFIVLVVEQGAKVEETGECLRELLAVLRVGDESAPVAGDALESADRFDGQPRQDLDDEVIGEVSGGAGPLLGAGWVHPRPRKSIYSDPNQSPPTLSSYTNEDARRSEGAAAHRIKLGQPSTPSSRCPSPHLPRRRQAGEETARTTLSCRGVQGYSTISPMATLTELRTCEVASTAAAEKFRFLT